MKQPFQIANEIAQKLGLPDDLRLTETRTLDPSAPSIYINDRRIVGGKPALGANLIRERKTRTIDLLQVLPVSALREIHAAVVGNSEDIPEAACHASTTES